MVVGLAAEQDRARGRGTNCARVRRSRPALGTRLEVLDDRDVGVEDQHALVVHDRGSELAVRADRDDRLDTGGIGDDHVLLTEGRRDVDDARAVLGGDIVRGQDLVGFRVPDVVAERRCVGAPEQLGSLVPRHDPLARILAELPAVCRDPRLRQEVALVAAGGVTLDHDVVDVRVHRHGQVAHHRPRGRRPDQRQLTAVEPVAHGDGRVLPHLVDLGVHPQLVVGQGGLVVPAVRQDAFALVEQTFVVQRLERPDD